MFIANKLPGGHRAFAVALGLEMGTQRWTEARARETVLKLNADLGLGSGYPTALQFRENGLEGLSQVIRRRFGGNTAFASELGLEMSDHRKWNKANARDAVLEFKNELGLGQHYPTMKQFREGGRSGVHHVIQKRLGGHRALAAELGLKMQLREKWDEASARGAVLGLNAKLGLGGVYPTYTQFDDEGMRGLCVTIPKLFGSHRVLAASLGLETSARTRARPIVSG